MQTACLCYVCQQHINTGALRLGQTDLQHHLETCSPQRPLVVSELGLQRGGPAADTCRRHTCKQVETVAQHMRDNTCSGDVPSMPGRGLKLMPTAGLLWHVGSSAACTAVTLLPTPPDHDVGGCGNEAVKLDVAAVNMGSRWTPVACGIVHGRATPCQPSHTAGVRSATSWQAGWAAPARLLASLWPHLGAPAPQSQKKRERLEYTTSWPAWHMAAHAPQQPRLSTRLHV